MIIILTFARTDSTPQLARAAIIETPRGCRSKYGFDEESVLFTLSGVFRQDWHSGSPSGSCRTVAATAIPSTSRAR
jgi:hypothetical protein